jgi:hypothetical protein
VKRLGHSLSPSGGVVGQEVSTHSVPALYRKEKTHE